MKIVYDFEINFQGNLAIIYDIEGAKFISNGNGSTKLIVTESDWETFCHAWKEIRRSDCKVIYMTQKRKYAKE